MSLSPGSRLGPYEVVAPLGAGGMGEVWMLSGTRAFRGESAADTLSAILMTEPRELSEKGRDIPPALDRIVRHCLEKNPAERFQSARDVAFDLDSLSTISTQSAPVAAAPGDSRKPRRGLLAAAVLLPLAMLVAGLALGRKLVKVSDPVYHQVSYRHGMVHAARFAPDGQTIVYSAAWGAEPLQVYLKRPESPDALPIGPPGANLLAISRSGEMALALDCVPSGHAGLFAGTLARAPLTGAAPREVLQGVQQADWAPDGSALAIVRDVGRETRLEFPPGKVLYSTAGHVSYPRFSPKGDRIAFFDHPLVTDNRGAVAIIDLAGKKTTLTNIWESTHGLVWSPAGDEIWFTVSPAGPMQALHGVTPAGRLRRIAQAPGALRIDDVSSGGRALVSQETQQLNAFAGKTDGSPERDLTWLEWSVARCISSDGSVVLFDEEATPVGANYAACLRKTDGSPVVRLGDGVPWGLSPDGKWVVSMVPSDNRRYWLLPTGAGEVRGVSFEGIETSRRVIFMPSGRELLFAARQNQGPLRLYVGIVDGGKARPATPEIVPGGFAVSPDGRAVVALGPQRVARIFSLLPGQEDRESRPVPGAEPSDTPLQWSADGRAIYVRRDTRDLPVRIFRLDLATGRAELWKEIRPADPAGASIASVVVSADGKSYAYSLSRDLSQLYLVEGLR